MNKIYTFNYVKGDKRKPSEVLVADSQEAADEMFRDLMGWQCVSDDIPEEKDNNQLDLF